MPPDKRITSKGQQPKPTQTVTVREESSSLEIRHTRGPIPSASELAEFEKVTVGLADRIVRMAEDEAKQRRSMEKMELEANVEYMRAGVRAEGRGQWLASVVTVILAGIGAYIATHGNGWAGAAIGSTGAVTIVTSLIYGRSRHPEDGAPPK